MPKKQFVRPPEELSPFARMLSNHRKLYLSPNVPDDKIHLLRIIALGDSRKDVTEAMRCYAEVCYIARPDSGARATAVGKMVEVLPAGLADERTHSNAMKIAVGVYAHGSLSTEQKNVLNAVSGGSLSELAQPSFISSVRRISPGGVPLS